MALRQTSCTTYTGPLASIPANASPGLLFLTAWFPVIDSLQDPGRKTFNHLIFPTTLIHNNSKPPTPLFQDPDEAAKTQTQTEMKMTKRAAALKSLTRELRRAWDVEKEGGGRTVFYESINYYAFAGDESEPVIMAEAGTFELEKGDGDSEGEATGGWRAIEVRSWHDPAPIRERRAELGC